MWDADITLPWLQPWVHKNDGGLINYSPGCRAYTRAKDSAAASPADSESSNSSGAICLDARLSCLQSMCKLILPKGFLENAIHTHTKWAPHKTQLEQSSSWSHSSWWFSTCSEGHWEHFPTTEKLLENRSTLKHFPIMFIRLDIVNYGSPICCVLYQPQCWFFFIYTAIPGPSCARCSTNIQWKMSPFSQHALFYYLHPRYLGWKDRTTWVVPLTVPTYCCGRSAAQAALPYAVLSSLQSYVQISSLWSPRRTWNNLPGVETSRAELSCTWPVPQWVKEM